MSIIGPPARPIQGGVRWQRRGDGPCRDRNVDDAELFLAAPFAPVSPSWNQGEGTGWRRLVRDDLPVMQCDQAPVEELTNLDGGTLEGPLSGARWDLQPAAGDGDDIVLADYSAIATREDAVEVSRRTAPCARRLAWFVGEACVEASDEAWEKALGVRQCAHASQTQLLDEAILERAPESFDATFGLRTLRRDVGNAEFLEDPTPVGRSLPALELLIERPVTIVSAKDARAVAVDRDRKPVIDEDLTEHLGVAVQIFVRTEDQRQNGPGRIIDGTDQSRRVLILQPGERAAIDQHQAAGTWASFAAATVLAGTMSLRRRQSQSESDAPHGVRADRQAILVQQIGDMRVVERRFGVLKQILDPASGGELDLVPRGLPSIPVNEAGRPRALKTAPQTTHLSDTERQRLCDLHVGHFSSYRGFQQAQPPGFAQSHSGVVHAPDTITAELTRTLSLRNYKDRTNA